jgi:hypothetical protein
MSKKDCGSCDYQGKVEQERAECRIDMKWHKRGFICDDFKDYVQGKSNGERVAEAHVIGGERRARKAAEELQRKQMEFDKKLWKTRWWWQLILVIIGAVLGVVGTIIFKP